MTVGAALAESEMDVPMQRKPSLLAACSLAALMATTARPVRALTCAWPGLAAPANDDVDVPTNTLVWCSRAAGTKSGINQLVDDDRVEVPGTQTVLSTPAFEVFVFHPDSEL